MVDQMIEGIFKDAGDGLFLEVDGDKLVLCIGIRLVSGHGYSFIPAIFPLIREAARWLAITSAITPSRA